MVDNVIPFPRPHEMRTEPDALGLYVRAGHNDHAELLNLLAAGDADFFGVVLDAVHDVRHRELRKQIKTRKSDAILEPGTQQSATMGGYT